MRKVLLLSICSLTCLFAFVLKSDEYRYVHNESFTTREVLTYRVPYGLIDAAEAPMKIGKNYFLLITEPGTRLICTTKPQVFLTYL